MPRFTFTIGKGLETYLKSLEQLQDENDEIMEKVVYAGANLVADAMKDRIKSLPVDNSIGNSSKMVNGLNSMQKAGLIESFGIAKPRRDGNVYNVKIGFDGYNGIKTKKFPKGQANSMIARSVESGTSFRKKNPFIAPTVRATKTAAENAMKVEYDTQVAKIMKK